LRQFAGDDRGALDLPVRTWVKSFVALQMILRINERFLPVRLAAELALFMKIDSPLILLAAAAATKVSGMRPQLKEQLLGFDMPFLGGETKPA
jgi:hypothetical protein